MDEQTKLLMEANMVMRNAYCPYSKFPVGAAILTEDDRVFTGCNVENASFGATICAERAAIVKAVSNGCKRFKAIAIVTGLNEPTSPCGICRQVLAEFGSFNIYLGSSISNMVDRTTVEDLLPKAFQMSDLVQFNKDLH